MFKAKEELWETSDLIRRLSHSLDIASKTLDYLAEDGFSDSDDENNSIRPEKAVGETAFLLLAASALKEYDEIKIRIEKLVHKLIPHARSKRMLLNILYHPPLAIDFAQAHICLNSLGYRDSHFDALLVKSVLAHSHFGKERFPHRMMEQDWIKNIWNIASVEKRNMSESIAYSSLANAVDLLNGSREDIYAFTHALMYASNFKSLLYPLPRNKELILDEAEAMVAKCLDEQDYDLCGEVLLTWPLTGSQWSIVSSFAFHVLTSIEDKAGFLPSPMTRIDKLEQLNGDHRAKYLYGTAYHTIYVMGLLCAVILQSGIMPEKRIASKPVVNEEINKLRTLLVAETQNPHWVEEFNKLNAYEQESLSGFLLNILLIRNIKRKNYTSVFELLSIGVESGIANTAIARQSAELLERLALLTTPLETV